MSSTYVLDDIVEAVTPEQNLLVAEMWARIGLLINSDLQDYDSATLADLARSNKTSFGGGELTIDRSFLSDKQVVKALAKLTPEHALDTLRVNAKHENPDTLIVRFLRARDWNLNHSLAMLFNSLAWRNEESIESETIPAGDRLPTEGVDKAEAKINKEITAMISSGQSFVHGADKTGRPIVYIRTRLHDPHLQGAKAFLKGCVLDVEATRMLLRPPVTCVSIVFDMTGFGMSNMDMNVLKVMASGLQNNYPECLGHVYVFNAPWILRMIWSTITSWLDPVVVGKIHFVNGAEALAEYIPMEKIPAYMGGKDQWEYEWVPPQPPATFTAEEITFRDAKRAEREKLLDEFIDLTWDWARATLQHDDVNAKAIIDKRHAIAAQLTENYWHLDRFVRGRVWLDRVGIMDPDGTVHL